MLLFGPLVQAILGIALPVAGYVGIDWWLSKEAEEVEKLLKSDAAKTQFREARRLAALQKKALSKAQSKKTDEALLMNLLQTALSGDRIPDPEAPSTGQYARPEGDQDDQDEIAEILPTIGPVGESEASAGLDVEAIREAIAPPEGPLSLKMLGIDPDAPPPTYSEEEAPPLLDLVGGL